MAEFFDLMLAPFAACLVLSLMHVYLGLHVVERGVIFVDLALAQIAAFGATCAFLAGFSLHSLPSYLFSLFATLLGACLFATTRYREQRIPQEAIIGIAYAVATGASVIILSFAPEGGEELKALLVGHLLFVTMGEVSSMALLYGAVGIFLWLARKKLLLISQDPARAFSLGMRVRLWDLLFYALFGVVVTSSTELAGVLLVFSFLVVPSVCALLFARTIRGRLLFGWGVGVLSSVAGVCSSYFLDLPTGATVVCIFGVALVFCALLQRFLAFREKAARSPG